jgi:4-amino-4-deoxy-L-arabinose transferase-like glycosyltransferase
MHETPAPLPPPARPPGVRRAALAAAALALVGAARIASTHTVFSHTVDEPAHVATGLQWLSEGVYDLEWQHPPLARVAAALGPFLAGRTAGAGDMWAQGRHILYDAGDYRGTLRLARLGTVPFFLAACAVVWAWARWLLGPWTAAGAVALFSTLPPVLGHGAVATTDMAVTATTAAALLAFARWLDAPGLRRASWMGLAAGAAVLSKFTALLFLPAACLALLAWRRLCPPDAHRAPRGARLRELATAALIAALLVWSGYRFSYGTLAGHAQRVGRSAAAIDANFTGMGPGGRALRALAHSLPVPAPELALGLNHVRKHTATGHASYLLGRYRRHGWWYFFPVALAVKTTLGFLGLVAVGLALLARGARRDWRPLAPAVAAGAILLVCLPSRINIGLRHVLPLYPLLAIVAAHAVRAAWRSRGHGLRAVVVVLSAWHLGASIATHPDYLAYFNELAAGRPERVLLDSDLDWGQDLLRLETLLRERGVPSVTIGYLGNADLDRHALPPFRRLMPSPPGERWTGWIAISEWVLKGVAFHDHDRFAWLEEYTPVARAGRSIRLYYVPEEQAARGSARP